MSDDVKDTRSYRSKVRQEQARRTRQTILDSARRLFAERGYAATTIAAIAADAEVAQDTVYAAAGRKPEIFRLLLETAISGTDEAVPAEERDYVRRVRAADRAREKIEIYAAAVREIGERMAPLHRMLREAAGQSPDLAAIRDAIAQRRAANMRLFAQDLAATGDLRDGLDVDQIADVVWSTSSAEFYGLLVLERGWTPDAFQQWLADTWCRLFLVPESGT
jgi:AcrR family transcriptional regulator